MAHLPYIHATDTIHWFMDDLCARVVAQTGIPSDRYHLGKLILQSLKDDPDFVLQIDGATGQSDTNKSVLQRSVQCAVALTKLGLKKGDVMISMGYNHLDIVIPLYTALYLGVIVYNVNLELKEDVLAEMFKCKRPKLIFCQSEKLSVVKNAVKLYGEEVKLITFNDNDENILTFSNLMTDFKDEAAVENFKPTDFDPEETIALITETSGTTGAPKGAAHTHKNLQIASPAAWRGFNKYPKPMKSLLLVTPLHWLSATSLCLFTPIIRITRIQTSRQCTKEHVCDLIDKYKPMLFTTTSQFMLALLENKDKYDFSGFKWIRLAGSLVTKDVFNHIKKCLPNADVAIRYGLSEAASLTFYNRSPPFGSFGQPVGLYNYRLVDVETQKDITEPNIQGELWMKGPAMFKLYYNDPKSTKEAFTEDGWFKTGDIMYRDENYNFFFVDRLKLLIHYKNYQISPLELEAVISQHPGVLHVVVTSVTDIKREELPCACVVTRTGHQVTEQDIKDLVKDSLPDPKHLRGRVIFLNEMPMTPQLKFDRRKIKELAINAMKN